MFTTDDYRKVHYFLNLETFKDFCFIFESGWKNLETVYEL